MNFKEKKALWDALCEWRRRMYDRGWLLLGTGLYTDCADRHAHIVGFQDHEQAYKTFSRWV